MRLLLTYPFAFLSALPTLSLAEEAPVGPLLDGLLWYMIYHGLFAQKWFIRFSPNIETTLDLFSTFCFVFVVTLRISIQGNDRTNTMAPKNAARTET